MNAVVSWLQKILVNDQGKTEKSADSVPEVSVHGNVHGVSVPVSVIEQRSLPMKVTFSNTTAPIEFPYDVYIGEDYTDPILLYRSDDDVIVAIIKLMPGQVFRIDE